jgi:hypothetical protein
VHVQQQWQRHLLQQGPVCLHKQTNKQTNIEGETGGESQLWFERSI